MEYRVFVKLQIKYGMNYRTVFFDLDGTLLDYRKSEKFALSETFKGFFRFSMPEDLFPVYHRINASCWAEYEKGLIDNATLRIKRFRELFAHYRFKGDPDAFSREYLENLSLGGWTIPGAEELLGDLKGKVRMAALTNGIGDVQKSRIARSGLEIFFDVVVISDIAGFAKPDKRIFEYTLKKMGLSSPREGLMVGDSLSSDIAGGINAGMDTCWFNPGNKDSGSIRPTYTVTSLDEIPSLLIRKEML